MRYSPDGQRILATHVETFFRDRLYLIDRATGESRPITRELTAPHSSHSAPAWAADGQTLYLLTDEDRDFRNLAALDLATGDLRYLTEESADCDDLAVSRDGRMLALTTNVDGYSRLDVYDISNGWDARQRVLPFEPERGVISELRWSREGQRLAFTQESSTAPRDIWALDYPIRRLRPNHPLGDWWPATSVIRRAAAGPLPHRRRTRDSRLPLHACRTRGARPAHYRLRSRRPRIAVPTDLQSYRAVFRGLRLCCARAQRARQHRLRPRLHGAG